MLWSLVKIVVFVLIVAAAALGASYLLELEGGVRIAFGAYEFNLTPLKSVIALLVLVLAIWIVIKLAGLLVATLRFINGDETAMSRYFNRSRERKGFEALSEGMMALASGEGRLAMHKAARAERYLARPELTTLLTAQAAEVAGDKRKAEESYKRLLNSDKTRFVGVRGLMKQKLAAGDTETALQLAQKAFALKPQHAEIQDTLLQLQAGAGEWKGARDTLKAKLRHGSMPRDLHKRRDAVLALSEAKAVIAEESSIEAREAAIEANKLSPDLIPAAVFAARAYMDEGKSKYAVRVLKKAWEASPHPDLAAAFAAIEPDESPAARVKRFATLTRLHPEHRETRLLQAELLIAAEDFPAARRAMGHLAQEKPDARALTIMAAIERGEGSSDAVVKGWLARAVTAPRGPQWTCENCHHIHAEWQPVCENCGAFDTLAWKDVPAAEVQSGMSQQMLPLIVGRLEETMATPPAPTPASAPATPPAPEAAAPAAPTAEVVPEAEVLPPKESDDSAQAARK
ncbi:heme biosynthesis protein HemY [Pseudooceanicola sp. CBS1P-1]|uniref:Heme biosynthesis protein HemY n=1 Tax=Pseudooceanicola albus TaxID=2692189 RepID=A0A6L7GB47_9RHOB|nr:MULTISPECIES: heme biosynthesis HemY N-terminal domain-containing protein [Pseudooceanicola]MBT9385781.1 heme biosynthesis protein HemY [Pseudooceanicola endophyticus]MXN20013.1 heme biosynthesis protein HemY [Pseudooceanicola albus]